METINNVAQAAANAVWGTSESKEEPVSGKTGNTSKGEPYDAGNIGKPRTTPGVKSTEFTSTPGDRDTSTGDNYTISSDKYTGATANTNLPPLEENYDPAGGVNTTGRTFESSSGSESKPASRYTENTDSTKLPPLEDNYDPAGGATKSATTSEPSGPHKEIGSSVKPNADLSHAQQDVRAPSDPQTDPKESERKSNVDDTGDGLDKSDNPDKLDGPGPRPIEDVAKQYGGDAGNAKPGEKQERSDEGADTEEGDGDGPQKTSSGEGSGERYVKSSGVQADGGDFDATKPGAGREADRLLESKGVHRDPSNPNAITDDKADSHEGKEKKSLGEKIKEKIHKPHFKH